MSNSPTDAATPLRVALACGGTGGHLYPGMAIGEALRDRGCDVQLLISEKEVDQRAVRGVTDLDVTTLPAVGLQSGQSLAFLRGSWRAWRVAGALFARQRPAAVVAMGGFTSMAPILAGRRVGAVTLLHEANSIPGRANRWLARWVKEAFVYFPDTATRLRHTRVTVTGMPVRSAFQPGDAAACRQALGLKPNRPVLLVMGGSQGARGLNEAVRRALPSLTLLEPQLQFIHLTGTHDFESIRQAHAAHGQPALVRPFLTEMDLALGAANVACSRAGASALAEIAAMRLPALLVPFPAAADDHQAANARAFARSGAARVLLEAQATADKVIWQVRDLLHNDTCRESIQRGLANWHTPDAAVRIAEAVLARLPHAHRAPSTVSPAASGKAVLGFKTVACKPPA